MAPPGAEPKNATKLEDRMTPQQLLWSQARNSPRNRGRSTSPIPTWLECQKISRRPRL